MFFSSIYIKYDDHEINNKSPQLSNIMAKTQFSNKDKIIYSKYLYYIIAYQCRYDTDIMKIISSFYKITN